MPKKSLKNVKSTRMFLYGGWAYRLFWGGGGGADNCYTLRDVPNSNAPSTVSKPLDCGSHCLI